MRPEAQTTAAEGRQPIAATRATGATSVGCSGNGCCEPRSATGLTQQGAGRVPTLSYLVIQAFPTHGIAVTKGLAQS